MKTTLKRTFTPSPSVRLVLTGDRLRRRHLIRLDGRAVWLPGSLFTALCRLVVARHTTQTGFIVESPLTIFRLRTLVDSDAAKRKDTSIIDTGDGHEYRLAIDPALVDAEPSFAELPSPALINHDEKQVLLKMHMPGATGEIGLKSV
jgi:hypothetical protein